MVNRILRESGGYKRGMWHYGTEHERKGTWLEEGALCQNGEKLKKT